MAIVTRLRRRVRRDLKRVRRAWRRVLKSAGTGAPPLMSQPAALKAHDATVRGEALLDLAASRPVPLRPPPGEVTFGLVARIDDEDRARIVQSLDEATRILLESEKDPQHRDAILLALAMAQDDARIMDRTGLTPHRPPEDVHAITRGILSEAGALSVADLVVEALGAAGFQSMSGRRILDFGCSSGRVIRPLAALHPDTTWIGCDPNRNAIEWARQNVPGEYFVSPQQPPVPLEDGSLDAAFAISIWSHFAPDAARTWLNEMHRVIKPGGLLMITTHGWRSLAGFRELFVAGTGGLSPQHVLECQRAFVERGWWFFDSFGPAGDWGVQDAEWGTSFYLPEWVLNATAGRWSCRWFRDAGLERNQDVYVFERI